MYNNDYKGIFVEKRHRLKPLKHRNLIQALLIWDSPLHVQEMERRTGISFKPLK